MNYIVWNNKDSREIKGLLICELPPITKPKMRAKETVIEGVDGSIIEELGYESYDKKLTVALKIGADVDEVMEYFTGNGNVIFSNEPDKYYIASIINGIDYSRLLRYRTAVVTFRVQPFKYDRYETEMVNSTDNQKISVVNHGNHTAKPIITVKGNGEVDYYLCFNSKVMLICQGREDLQDYMLQKVLKKLICIIWRKKALTRHFRASCLCTFGMREQTHSLELHCKEPECMKAR